MYMWTPHWASQSSRGVVQSLTVRGVTRFGRSTALTTTTCEKCDQVESVQRGECSRSGQRGVVSIDRLIDLQLTWYINVGTNSIAGQTAITSKYRYIRNPSNNLISDDWRRRFDLQLMTVPRWTEFSTYSVVVVADLCRARGSLYNTRCSRNIYSAAIYLRYSSTSAQFSRSVGSSSSSRCAVSPIHNTQLGGVGGGGEGKRESKIYQWIGTVTRVFSPGSKNVLIPVWMDDAAAGDDDENLENENK